jgi:DNA-binding CsgD family transcriptional regulator
MNKCIILAACPCPWRLDSRKNVFRIPGPAFELVDIFKAFYAFCPEVRLHHFIFAVSITAFVLAASSAIMALSAYKWGRGETFKHIGFCALTLAAMVALYAAISYKRIADIALPSPLYAIARAVSGTFITGLWYLLSRSLYRLMSVRWSGGKRMIHLIIALSPLPFHILSYIFRGQAQGSLYAVRNFLIDAQSLTFVYILLRYRGRVTDSDVKRLVNASLVLMAIFAPLFFIENLSDWIWAYYESLGLVWPSLLLLLTLIILAAFRFTINFIMKPRAKAVQEPEPAFLRELGLTEREIDVIRLLLKRRSYREIGERLFISVPTVKSHVHHAFQKLDVGTREELSEMAEGLRK